uniref:Uncharacterized protein n=1 Tax=Romanomermis culicivorax TaxID=13658 RepID=A0A915HIJ5_ROMCU
MDVNYREAQDGQDNTNFILSKLEKEQARKWCENIDYILTYCIYDLELVIKEMMDKPKAQMVGISPEVLNLKALMMELTFLWVDAYKISWGQLNSLEFRQLMDADKLSMEDMIQSELIADLARKFKETLEKKERKEEGEAIATYKLAEEQTSINFYCPPNFSNCEAENEAVPRGQYPWIERKVKMPKKKKVCDEDEEPENDSHLYDILAAKSFGRSIEKKDIRDGCEQSISTRKICCRLSIRKGISIEPMRTEIPCACGSHN